MPLQLVLSLGYASYYACVIAQAFLPTSMLSAWPPLVQGHVFAALVLLFQLVCGAPFQLFQSVSSRSAFLWSAAELLMVFPSLSSGIVMQTAGTLAHTAVKPSNRHCVELQCTGWLKYCYETSTAKVIEIISPNRVCGKYF